MDVTVRVTVSYRCNPALVRDLLVASAARCEGVAAEPAPIALLDDFAANGFGFVLRARTAGTRATDETASALRFLIVEAFRDNDIEIAVPQTDLRWRDLDFIRQAFALAASRRGDKESPTEES
jgi:small-conductance mechanosensitive channel